MNKNQLFFGTKIVNSMNDIYTNKTFVVNFLLAKTKFQIVSLLFFLTITNSSYGQLSTENFNSGIPSSWAVRSNQTVTNNWVPSLTGGLQSSGAATVNPASNNTAGTRAEYFLITPQVTVPTDGEFRFYTRQGSFANRGTEYQLRVSTANQPDISSFNVVLQTWTETQLNTSATTYEQKIVPVPTIAGLNVYFALVAITNQTAGVTNTLGDTWFVDNVRVITACPQVTGITTVLGSDNAVINWTHPTATNFSVQVVPAGAGIGTSGTPVVGTTYTATGLTANTPYDFYIRTDCDADTTSNWAGPFRFTTIIVGLSCATPIVIPSNITSTPYILNSNLNQFYTPVHPDLTTVGSNCFPPDPFAYNQLLGNRIFFNYTPTTSGLIDIRQAVSVISGGGPNACFNALSSVLVYNSCADVGGSCLAAITTVSNNTTNQISNFYVEAGHTYVIVMSSPYTHTNPGASLCFTFTVSGSSCPAPAPTGTTYNNLTQTSTSFSWSNVQNLVSAWEYVVLPVSSGLPDSGTVGIIPTNTNVNNPISGLTPNTSYNLFVRSVCNGIPGSWAAAVPFRTPCNTLAVPYYTGFTPSDGTVECWSQLNLNNDLNSFTFGNNAFSEPVARCRTQNSNDILVSPQFQLDGVTQKRLRFKFNNYGNWGLIVNNPAGGRCTFEVRLSTTGVGPNNFTTVVLPVAQYTTAYNFIELIVPIPNVVGDVNIAWILPPGALQEGNWFYVDDVYIEDLPACSEPSYPLVNPSSITTTSASISWTNGFNNSQWQVVVQPEGTGAPTTSGTLVNTNPYTYTGLIPSTRYEVYVRAYCNQTEQSIWVGPIYFHTACDAQPVPYYESLDTSDLNTKKFCWSTRNISDDNTEWFINENDASIRQAPSFFTPFGGFDDWLVSGPINAVGLKRLRFNYKAAINFFAPVARGNFEVLMSTVPDFSTYTTIIPSFDFTNTNFIESTSLFTGTGVVYIAFRVPPTMDNPGNSGLMVINDVTIDDAPACPSPTSLNTSNPTATGITFGWTAGYLETAWEVSIQEPGGGVPTANGIPVLTTPTYTAVGLLPNTQYEYYVRAVCNQTTKSEWVGPILFRTDCTVYPSPFIETFEPNSDTKSCWKIIDGNGNGNTWSLNSTVQPIFGEMMASMFTGTNGNNNDWLISPTITVQPNQRLRFYYKVYDEFFEEDLKIKISSNGSDISQFTTTLYENSLSADTDATGVVEGSNTITLASAADAARVRQGDFIYIPNFPFPYPTYVASVVGNVVTMTTNATITQTGVQNVQFEHKAINNEEVKEMVINLTDISAPTDINFAFYIPFFPPNPWAYRSQLLFVDNFIIEDIPACPSVTNVTTSNLIDTSVTIDWEVVGSETSWEISVQPLGTPAPVGNTMPEYLTTTTSHPKTISGLIPATQYQYYVRAICSESSQSEWVGPFDFTTRCDFSNVCQYTITTISGNTGQVSQSVNVMQNGVVVQELEFPGFGQTIIDYTVFLCRGVAFDLYWLGLGSGTQYSQAQIIIKDELDNVVWTSPLGLGDNNTNIYSGFASCGVITCPQPTNLSVNNQGAFSWTPGGSETQWEVFVQPFQNGTLPQSGTIVNSPSYTPSATDFADPTMATYEYFVRAICGPNDKSYWSGPKTFVRNDEPVNAIHLQVNSNETCNTYVQKASFIGATASTIPTSCEGVNGGDVWFDFVATSKVHYIEIKDLSPGSYYTSSFEPVFPRIMMSLYQQMPDNSLVEMGCSDNNSFTAIYSTELVVGNTYKIRLKLNSTSPNEKTFSVCVTTPNNMCDINAFNYSFEKPPMQTVTGIPSFFTSIVVPGWRTNTNSGSIFFQEELNTIGSYPTYEGGQMIQLIADDPDTWNANDTNIKGLYKDFDTSELTEVDYSFASASRNTSTLQLYAGPPTGPFTLIATHFANEINWKLVTGTYIVPTGQSKTRFIFRPEGNELGHLLDAANFKAPVDILTDESVTLDCVTTTTTLVARGVGQWEANANNPSVATIATPNSTTTTVSGITAPGNYIFHWKTRYCDKMVTITKQGNTETAVVVNPTVYCLNATALPLTATVSLGNTVNWFTETVGGTGTTIAPTPSTSALGSTQVYYAASVDGNGCEGTRAQIIVQVDDLPIATISGTTTICSGTTAVITFNGTPNATVTYTVNGGSNQTITLNGTGFATLNSPTLTANASYNLVSVTSAGTNPCSQTQTGSAIVTVETQPTATISGTTSICSGATAVITFNGTPNATVTYTVNGGTNQTITLDNSGTATITTPALTSNSTYALVSVDSSGTPVCSQTQTGSAVVTVNALPTATISGTTSICSGATAVITFNGTPNATVTYTVNGGTNQTITLDNSGAATITTPALSSNSTYALVSVASGTTTCSQTQSGSAVVTVNALPTATISGTTSICSGATAVITFNGTPNATVTYTVNGGTNQTITLDNSGAATITTPALSSNSTYALVSVASGTTTCSQTQSGSAVVTVNALPTATISGTTTICSGTTAVITFNGTPNATVTYTVNGGSNQTITLNGTGFATLNSPTLTANASYNLVSVTSAGTNPCSQTQTGSAIVTVETQPTATISGTTSICSGATAVITFNGTPNATVTYTVNGGTNQTITLDNSGTATITTPALTSNSTYALVSVDSSGTPVCSQTQTGSAVVTVNALPTATISGTTSICSGATAVITFNGTPNATVTYTVNGGTNQTITLDNSGAAIITTPALSSNSTYALVSVASGTTTCSQTQTGSAVVTVNALPTATISGTTSICRGTTAVITFTGTPNAVVTYTVNGGTNQTITLDNSGAATITTPALSSNSTYALVSVASGTTTCSQTQSGSAVVTVNALPTATISGTTSICSGATAVITFNGTPNATVTYTVNGGTNQTITLDNSGAATITTPALSSNSTFALVSVASGITTCSQTQTGSAVVTVNALPTATISGTTAICSGATALITFNGTPNATVTYTVNGGTNQTITLDNSGAATITTPALSSNSTYALVSVSSSGTLVCSQTQTGSAIITVNPLPTAAISGTTAICSGATALITFNGTPNATVTYTVNGGTNQTITLDNSGAAIITTPALSSNSTYALVSVSSSGTPVCSQTQTGSAVVTVNPLPTATISGTTSICRGTTAVITFTGTPNAVVTYTVNGGTNQTITLNATGTASITTSALTANSTYALVSVASGTTTCNQTQTGLAIITIEPELTFNIDAICENSMLVLKVTDANFNTNDATYIWTQAATTVGTNTTFNVDEYLAQNPSVTLPLLFSLSLDLNGCIASQNFTVENNPCRIIPRGISPNNDQLNDTFDLTGFGVQDIIIFNRYGTKVFSYSGNYTNQWKGQSDGGDELPDGTYFYSIHLTDGLNRTGWVYINREY
jgi:gliding motility-associated-like protein